MDSRGGTSKGGGKRTSGGGSVKITKSKEMQTKQLEERIIHLRRAIFNEDGRDKDVTIGIAAAFLKYDRNGLDVEIKFSHCLNIDEIDWAFAVVKCNMEDIYDASGYQWDDDDKEKELTEGMFCFSSLASCHLSPAIFSHHVLCLESTSLSLTSPVSCRSYLLSPGGARFLLVREKPKPGDIEQGRLVAFAHFRFSVQGEVMDKMEGETMLYVWDIHVEDEYQRKGLGRHMLTLMELIARREGTTEAEKNNHISFHELLAHLFVFLRSSLIVLIVVGMKMIALPVQLNDERTLTWINAKCKGYEPDKSLLAMIGFDSEMEGFDVYAKTLDPPKPKPVNTPISEQEKASIPPKSTTTTSSATETPKKVVVIATPSPCGVDEGACSPMPTRRGSGGSEGSPVPSLEVWQTMTARSPSSSPRKSSSSSIDSTTKTKTTTTTTNTTTPRGTVPEYISFNDDLFVSNTHFSSSCLLFVPIRSFQDLPL